MTITQMRETVAHLRNRLDTLAVVPALQHAQGVGHLTVLLSGLVDVMEALVEVSPAPPRPAPAPLVFFKHTGDSSTPPYTVAVSPAQVRGLAEQLGHAPGEQRITRIDTSGASYWVLGDIHAVALALQEASIEIAGGETYA